MPTVPQALVITFLSLVFLVHTCISILFYRFAAKDKRLKLIAIWYAVPLVCALLALSGITQRFTLPPPALILNVVLFGSALFFVRTKSGTHLIENAPLRVLVGLQAFRLPLELLLNELAEAGTIPVEMTFHGYNFDILTGILALAFLLYPKRWLAWLVQGVGIACLLAIITIVVISLPKPFGLTTPAFTLPTYFPFIWLPTVLVLAAVLLHGLSVRALLRQKNA